jgi:hypothetical protein
LNTTGGVSTFASDLSSAAGNLVGCVGSAKVAGESGDNGTADGGPWCCGRGCCGHGGRGFWARCRVADRDGGDDEEEESDERGEEAR